MTPSEQHGGARERQPECVRLAVSGSEHVETVERYPGAAAQPRVEGDQDAEHLCDHPHADGELSTAQAQHDQRGRHRHRTRAKPGDDHRFVGREPMLRQEDRPVRPEPDEGLLADRDEASIPGECIPHDGEDHEDEQRGQLLGHIGPEQKRHDGEHNDHGHGQQCRDDREPGPALHPEAAAERGAARADHAVRPRRESRPPRGDASTARNTR